MEDEEEFNRKHGVGLGEKGILSGNKIPYNKAMSLGPFAEGKSKADCCHFERLISHDFQKF